MNYSATPFDEPFNAFRFDGYADDDEGRHDGPHPVNSQATLMRFVSANVIQYPEIRIVDSGDFLVMHVRDQELIFPVPEHAKGSRLKWNLVTECFEVV